MAMANMGLITTLAVAIVAVASAFVPVPLASGVAASHHRRHRVRHVKSRGSIYFEGLRRLTTRTEIAYHFTAFVSPVWQQLWLHGCVGYIFVCSMLQAILRYGVSLCIHRKSDA